VLSLLSVAAAKPPERVETLTLDRALSRAMMNNPFMASARFTLELADISYQNAWETMFLPRFTMGTAASAPYTIAQLPRSNAKQGGSTGTIDPGGLRDHGSMVAQPYVAMGEYTLFNFGRDKDVYEINKLAVDRAKQVIKEAERAVRFDVIVKFYSLKTQQELLDVAERSVQQAQAIYDLYKSRVALGKAGTRDVSSAQVDLLTARSVLVQQESTYNQALWALNMAIGDRVNTKYRAEGDIHYAKLRTPLEELLRLYKENSPTVRDARLTHEVRQIALRLAEKNSLPLPVVTFSGITVGQNYGTKGTTQVRSTTAGTDSGNVNVSASLNFSIPLTGDGGLFGSRTRRAAEIAAESAENDLRVAANVTEVSIRTSYQLLTQYLSQIEIFERIFRETSVVFESSVKMLSGTGTNRLDTRDAISQLRTAEQNLNQAILNYYAIKLDLAKAVGIDKFPEDDE
jgi:outer membrane protein TolC